MLPPLTSAPLTSWIGELKRNWGRERGKWWARASEMEPEMLQPIVLLPSTCPPLLSHYPLSFPVKRVGWGALEASRQRGIGSPIFYLRQVPQLASWMSQLSCWYWALHILAVTLPKGTQQWDRNNDFFLGRRGTSISRWESWSMWQWSLVYIYPRSINSVSGSMLLCMWLFHLHRFFHHFISKIIHFSEE